MSVMRLALSDGRTVTVRNGTAEDAQGVRDHYNRALTAENPYFPVPRERHELDRWLRRGGYLDFQRNFHWLALAGDRIVAHLLFVRTDKPSIRIEGVVVPYMVVAPEFRGAGLGTALLQQFDMLMIPVLRAGGIHRVEGHIFPENRMMLRVARQLGADFEGVLRQHVKGADGRYHNMILVGRILTDRLDCPRCRGIAERWEQAVQYGNEILNDGAIHSGH